MGSIRRNKMTLILIVALLFSSCAFIVWSFFKFHHPTRFDNNLGRHFIAIIDAGHGAFTHFGLFDEGATRYGVKEADVAIAIAKKLQKELEKRGWIAITTRDGDFTPFGLIERARLSSLVNADVFVSIHLNSYRNSKPHGLSVHYWSEESRPLAKLMQTRLCRTLGLKDRGVVRQPLTVLTWASVPAILIELGFISNPAEVRRLTNTKFQDKAAKAMADTLTMWACGRCDESTPCSPSIRPTR